MKRLLLLPAWPSLLLAGCAALSPAPFEGFHQSVGKAQIGLESAMTQDVNWTREADIQYLADGRDVPLSGYMIKEATGTRWTMSQTPPSWDARLSRRALEELNAAFHQYTALLIQIVDGRVRDPEEFDALASALNEDIRVITDAYGRGPAPGKPHVAGFSALATESLRRFVRARRAAELKAAISQNQLGAENYAAQCLALLAIIRANLKASYADQMGILQDRWEDKRSPGRITLARTLFNLNEGYADTMETLEALTAFYARLPQAHKALADGLTGPKTPRTALAALGNSAARIARLARKLEKEK